MNGNGRTIVLGILLLILFVFAGLNRLAQAQTSDTHLTAGSGSAAAAQPFAVKAAVDAYLASVPAAQRARSDAYFEGGYWLLLVDFIYTIVVMRVLLRTRWSARMRNFAGRITRSRFLQPAA